MTRAAIAVVTVVALAGFGVGFDPDPAQPGEPVTVSGPPQTCLPGSEVSIYVESNYLELEMNFPEGFEPAATTTAAADGSFAAAVVAPDRPGQHAVVVTCTPDPGVDDERLGAQQAAPQVVIVDFMLVDQVVPTLSAEPSVIVSGGSAEASATWCQSENDHGLFALLGDLPEDWDPEPALLDVLAEAVDDQPTMDLYVDGELVHTFEAGERYPEGLASIELDFDELGEYELQTVCRYQTVRLELREQVQDVGAAQDYPLEWINEQDSATLVIDEATIESNVATVTVVAADAVEEEPVVEEPRAAAPQTAPAAQAVTAAPTFTG